MEEEKDDERFRFGGRKIKEAQRMCEAWAGNVSGEVLGIFKIQISVIAARGRDAQDEAGQVPI